MPSRRGPGRARARHAHEVAPGGEAGARRRLQHRHRLTPPASSSQASCRFSGPLPAISTRSPGETRWVRTRVCRPPVVITPGRVQPGIGTGASCAPVARIRRRGR